MNYGEIDPLVKIWDTGAGAAIVRLYGGSFVGTTTLDHLTPAQQSVVQTVVNKYTTTAPPTYVGTPGVPGYVTSSAPLTYVSAPTESLYPYSQLQSLADVRTVLPGMLPTSIVRKW